MSDETNKKSAMAEIVQALKEPGATNAEVILPAAKEIVLPPAKQIGKGLEDLFFVFFSPLSNKRMKIEAKQKELFDEVEQRVSQIEPEKLTEPSLSITGRAIDESKFHVEEDSIRSMFAKLIAASVNSDYKDATLPAFIEVLKQLSPFDAKNLIELHEINKLGEGYRQVGFKLKIYFNNQNEFSSTIMSNFIPFEGVNYENSAHFEASIENLMRLGLISIRHEASFENKTFHNELGNHPIIKETEEIYQKLISESPNAENKSIEIRKADAIWDFTEFGRFFIKCCLEEVQ